MEVILLEDVPNVGKKYEEHEVADGYGTNYLLPQGLARVATDRTRAQFEQKRKELKKKRRQQREEKAESLEKLDGMDIEIAAPTGDQGQLFAGVYPEDVVAAINQEVDIELKADDVDRDQPLQKVGEYEVKISILDESATVAVAVVSE